MYVLKGCFRVCWLHFVGLIVECLVEPIFRIIFALIFGPNWLGEAKLKQAFRLPKHGFAAAALRKPLQIGPATVTLPVASPLGIRVVRNSTSDCVPVGREPIMKTCSTQGPPWFGQLVPCCCQGCAATSREEGKRGCAICREQGREELALYQCKP